MRISRTTSLLAPAALLASLGVPGAAQVVTVSATPDAAMETTIQAAVESLAPGGSRDDGNPANNVVSIIDGAIYREALSIVGLDVTIAGTAQQRPTIITPFAAAVANPGVSSVYISTDGSAILRRLVILPDAANPANIGLFATQANSGAGLDLGLDRVLVSANDGADAPVSEDGFAAPGGGVVRFGSHAIEIAGNGTGRHVQLDELVVTSASGPGADLLRFRASGATMTVGPGCALTYSLGVGLRLTASSGSAISWLGTQQSPVVLHGNAGAAITSNTSSSRAAAAMQWVAITRNSTGFIERAVTDAYVGPLESSWSNVTIAGNSTSDGASPTDGPLSIAGPFVMQDVILAGDGMETPRQRGNTIALGGAASLSGDGLLIDLSQGATTLNVMRGEVEPALADGVDGGAAVATGAGIVTASPAFLSLEPSSADYLKVTSDALRGAGPGGEDLAGAGELVELAFSPIRSLTGNLQTYMEGVTIPSSSSSSKFQQPTPDMMGIFREAVDNIAAGRLQAAANLLSLVNYDLIAYTDTPQDDRRYAVLRERTNPQQHWGGLHAIDLEPRTNLFIASPHPLYDGTRVQAIDIFFRTQALGFTQSGTHRNNSPVLTPCSGTFTNGDPYRISDPAHNDQTFFQVMHEQTQRRYPGSLSVNVHGMGASSDPSDVVISNGTGDWVFGPSLSRDIADTMNAILDGQADARYAVSHQEPGENPIFSGSTNTQGRFTNGSHRPCTLGVQALFPERFIHMEQSPTVRSGPSSLWDFVVDAYNTLVPDVAPWVQGPLEDGSAVLHYALDGDLEPEVGESPGAPVGILGPVADRHGLAGKAMELGASSYFTIPDAAIDGPDRELAITFWFKAPPSASGFQYIYSHGSIGESEAVDIPASVHLLLDSAGGGLRVRHTLQNGEYLSFNGPSDNLDDDEWHFVAVSTSATETSIYVDGALLTSVAGHGGQRLDPEGPIFLGARSDLSPGRFLAPFGTTGALDDVIIFNRALSAQEVLDLFLAPPAGPLNGWQLR